MAVESGNNEDLVAACRQVLSNCCVSDLDVDLLTTFDLEYLFLKLRAQSVNNVSKLAFIDKEDDKRYEFDINLDEIEVKIPKNANNKVQAGSVTLVMKYPTMTVASAIMGANDELTMLDKMVVGCIDYLYDGETIYNEFTEQELLNWLDQQPTEVYNKIRAFFDTMPQLEYEIKYTNSKGNERTIRLAGLADFFGW